MKFRVQGVLWQTGLSVTQKNLKNRLFFLLGALLSICLGFPNFSSGSPSNADTLIVATLNTEWLTGSVGEVKHAPWKNDLDLERHHAAIAEAIAATHADVIALMEVTSQAGLNRLLAQKALKGLGYQGYHLKGKDDATGQDISFLSTVKPFAFPGNVSGVRRSENEKDFTDPAWIDLKNQEGFSYNSGFHSKKRHQKKNRNMPASVTKHGFFFLQIGKHKIGILAMHLLAHPDDPSRKHKREGQARLAIQMLRQEVIFKGFEPIVLGDLNDFDYDISAPKDFKPLAKTKRSEVLSILKDPLPDQPGPELWNVFSESKNPESLYSVYRDKNKNGRLDAMESKALLDHILISQRLRPNFKESSILHATPVEDASDHWPVRATLVFPKGP